MIHDLKISSPVWQIDFRFCFYFLCLKKYNQKDTAKTHVKDCAVYVFFHEFHALGFYIQVFSPYWADLCVQHKVVVYFNSSVCGCHVFPTPFIEETLFQLYALCFFAVN